MATSYLFITTGIPDADADVGGELIMLDTGFEDVPEGSEIPTSEFEFASTLVTTFPESELTPDVVSQWWEELTGAPAQISVLADDIEAMSESEKQRVAALGGSGWSVNSSFVAYKRGSRDAQLEAIEFIRECALADQ